MSKIIPSLSKMWLKVTNLENSLFPKLQESLGILSSKEEKLIKILDFAQIEQFIYDTHITTFPKIEFRWQELLLLRVFIIFRQQGTL